MKKTTLLILILAAFSPMAVAQQLIEDSYDRLSVHYETPDVSTQWRKLGDKELPCLTVDGYQTGGEIGAPALPMLTRTIEVPFCDDMVVEVSNALYDTLDLPATPLWPLQKDRTKSDTLAPRPVLDTAIYAADAYYGSPLAKVLDLGIARDRRLAQLTFAPVQVNPVAGKMVVCRSADVTVRYVNADRQATQDHFARYFTPAFAQPATLNALHSTKDATAEVPVRMVIVEGQLSGIASNASVQAFVDWKRKQGMLVDVIDASQGWTAQQVADSLMQMYTSATPEAPAPTFVLLMGDHQQLPAFASRLATDNQVMENVESTGESRHYTDLYFVTWTSDYLPDGYVGRLSAENMSTLSSIISKTLLYEQYAFSDDSYLAHAALVSGVDGGTYTSDDGGYNYSDPTMDYAARHYVNADNGYTEVVYYKNNTDYAPAGVTVTGSSRDYGTASALRAKYDEGMGFINYSAHGYATSWYRPSFTVTNASNMQNVGKPSVVIGNCCLTSQFYNTTCLAEAMLRRGNNAGAVIYVGGVNLTYWENDFHWAVGVRGNIYGTMSTNYSSSRLGVYDRLFHTHNETVANRASTAGAMMVAGQQAVNSTANNGSWYSDMAKYYWEVYELMGDPSLLPWLGCASDMPMQLAHQGECLQVTTAPYAYVAVVDSGSITPIAASFADASGSLCLNIGDGPMPSAFVTATAAGYKPLQVPLSAGTVGIAQAEAAACVLAPNPASASVTVTAPDIRRVEVLDMAGHRLMDQTATGNGTTLDVSRLQPGVYFVRIHTDNTDRTMKLIVK